MLCQMSYQGNYIRNAIPSLTDREPGQNRFIRSELVEVKENDSCRICMQYPLRGFHNAEKICMARKEANQMLERAQQLLPSGMKFVIWDAWRPFALQAELFQFYTDRIVRRFHLEDMEETERRNFISQFVADPDPLRPPGHTTGGAFDLTIMDASGHLLDMGTEFDAFREDTYADYYEKILDGRLEFPADLDRERAVQIRNNRRFLWSIMTEAGFSSISSEWWHFDYGDRNWSAQTGQPVLYDGIFARP